MSNGSASVTAQSHEERELRIPAEESQLSRVRDFIAEVCEEAGFSSRETNNTKLAVDEACTNIIKHAYGKSAGEIRIRTVIGPGHVSVKLHDTGERFDFAGVEDPDLDHYVETGRKGGLGVFLINRLMDNVQYRAGETGNELTMTKTSHAGLSRSLPGRISWRGTLRYKFTLRASLGLFFLLAAIWSFVFIRQTGTIKEQQTTQWIEKRRLAENLAERSKAALLQSDPFAVERTDLTAYLTKVVEGNSELDYVRVVDPNETILASNNVDEIYQPYESPPGEVLLQESGNVAWSHFDDNGRPVRDIAYTVRMRNEDADRELNLGVVHLGVLEDAIAQNIRDPRLMTTLMLILFFLIGVLLIAALVSVFVKPIQVLTDGVRAIGQGSLDSKISVEGPAEIGAIAAVFNEIQAKFKKAQEGVLEREKLQKEIEVAKQIQHALLPKKHPDISGYDIAPYYQAAKEVGGDYYDFVQVDEDTLGVVVADVSGKGVPGSLVMTMIRTALRMEARGNKNASDVMSKMNDFVTDDMKKGMFVTMFYVILDSKNRIISYASAGHNPMILYRSESNETFFLNPKGFPVGISLPDETLFRRAISLEKIKLKKDDMLLIYTDGVTEAMDEKREQYGEDRLIEAIKKHGHLHPTEFIKRLEMDIKQFTGGNAQNDDITVVAIKEKLTADDVLFGIRKKLMDMVEVGGMSVKEACAKMKVSPATFYRYKKRMETMGERGLKNKVLRQDVDLKRVSIEERKKLIQIIKDQPELGAKRIAEEYNENNTGSRELTQRMVYDELKRLGLNTKELRIEYLKRHQLYEEDQEAARRSSREMVEELIKEVSSEPAPSESDLSEFELPDVEPRPEPVAADDAPAEDSDLGFDLDDGVLATEDFDEEFGDLVLSAFDGPDDLSVLKVDGHLDSVSTGALEERLDQIIAGGAFKIAVDLSNVTYISSGGWGILVGEVKRLREQSGDVVLVGMTSDVYDVYELLGFSEILHALPDIGAAVSYFQKPVEERVSEPPKPKPAEPVLDASVPVEDQFDGGVRIPSEPVGSDWDSLRIEAATVGEKGDIAVLSLTGIIDTVSAENLRTAIDKVIGNGIYKIVVDMSMVEYVSSGGWGTFTERLRELRRGGGDIKLFGMDPDVYYIFTMLGFNIVLSSFDILTDAIEDFKRAVDGKPSAHPEQRTETAPAAEAEVDTPFDEPEPPVPVDDVFDDEEVQPATGVDELEAAQLDDSGTAGIADVEADRARPVEPDVPAGAGERDAHKPSRVFHSVTSDGDWGRWEESDGVLVGSISGPIEAVAVERLDREIDTKLESKPYFVLLDLRGVDYISSTGWGLVAKYYDRIKQWDGTVALCGMNQDLFEIFSFLEFNSFIRTFMTREQAIASLDAPPTAAGDAPAGTAVAMADDSLDDYVADDEPSAETALGDQPDLLEPADSVEDILDDAGDVEGARRGVEDAGWVEETDADLFEETHDEMAPGDESMSVADWEVGSEERDSHEESAVQDTADESVADEPSGWEMVEWKPTPPASQEPRPRPVEPVGPAQPTEPAETPDDHWEEEPNGDEIFVDLSRDSHRVDVRSAVDDERLLEDDKLRDLGWSQYGQRLRKIVNKERVRKPKPVDDDDES